MQGKRTKLGNTQATAEKKLHNGSIALALGGFGRGRLKQLLELLNGEDARQLAGDFWDAHKLGKVVISIFLAQCVFREGANGGQLAGIATSGNPCGGERVNP